MYVGYMVTRVQDAARDFDVQFDVLMNTLKDQGDRAGGMMRHLTFRLDFNEYYLKSK